MTNGFFFPKLPAAWLPLLVFRCRPSTLLFAILAQADGNSWDAAKIGAWTDLKKKNNRFRGDGPTRMDCIQDAGSRRHLKTKAPEMIKCSTNDSSTNFLKLTWRNSRNIGTFSPKRQECRAPKCLTPPCRVR